MTTRNRPRLFGKLVLSLIAIAVLLVTTIGAQAAPTTASAFKGPSPIWSSNVAFDISPALRSLKPAPPAEFTDEVREVRPEPGPAPANEAANTPDGALQSEQAVPMMKALSMSPSIAAPVVNFEGLSNEDNYNLTGYARVNPPDPVGDVGPNHYVEMVNWALAIYDKQGNRLVGPTPIGEVWSGFAINNCTDPLSGLPVVLYDQFADRWLLSQVAYLGDTIYYYCVAISQTSDPTGAYYRYAFMTQPNPNIPGKTLYPYDPKISVWKDSYILTNYEFGSYTTNLGISVYGLEKNKMVNGSPNARAVEFFLDPNVVPRNLIGDGLLPPDIDGNRMPKKDAPAPLIGTQDDGAGYGATVDAINIWEFNVQWNPRPVASLSFAAQLPVAPFNSVFPCAPDSHNCLPQPGITDPAQYVDIQSYRQRPLYRLAYRDFRTYETFVTNQSVEAMPGVAGVRWYEIRRINGVYSLYQQGTYAPNDGVHRWNGSVAMDKFGNIAAGYSVVNGVDVYPGIRYTGRLAGDPLGQMTLGEGTIIDGTGVQLATTWGARWGEYTSLNVDPVDDCTFWYVNEYYTLAGQLMGPVDWQTRIASFKLPGCP